MEAALKEVSNIGFALGEFAEHIGSMNPDGIELMGDLVHEVATHGATSAEQVAQVIRKTLAEFDGVKSSPEVPDKSRESTTPAEYQSAAKGLEFLMAEAPDSWLARYIAFAADVIHDHGVAALQQQPFLLASRFAELFNAANDELHRALVAARARGDSASIEKFFDSDLRLRVHS